MMENMGRGLMEGFGFELEFEFDAEVEVQSREVDNTHKMR
jgi:hypothetical protein